jgi:hypothetical protein
LNYYVSFTEIAILQFPLQSKNKGIKHGIVDRSRNRSIPFNKGYNIILLCSIVYVVYCGKRSPHEVQKLAPLSKEYLGAAGNRTLDLLYAKQTYYHCTTAPLGERSDDRIVYNQS